MPQIYQNITSVRVQHDLKICINAGFKASVFKSIFIKLKLCNKFYVHVSVHRESMLKCSSNMTLLFSILFPANSSTYFGRNIHLLSAARINCPTHPRRRKVTYCLSLSDAVIKVYSDSWLWVNISPETCRAVCRE
jgi:hypothetical protein